MTDFLQTVWSMSPAMCRVVSSRFYLSSSAIESVSPWSGTRTASGPYMQVFVAELEPPAAPGPKQAGEGELNWREWQGFITRLRGTAGRVRCYDYYRQHPQYNVLHTPTAARWSDNALWSDGSSWQSHAIPPFVTLDEAALEEADSIVVRGLPASTELALNPADLIELRPDGQPTEYSNLYEIVHAARSNADGKARVYLQPGLRQGFAAGDMVVLYRPTGVFRLADKSQGVVTRSMGNIGRLGLKLIEELRNDA